MERVALAHSRALNRRPNYFSLFLSLWYRYLPIDRSIGRFLLAVSSVWGPSSWGPVYVVVVVVVENGERSIRARVRLYE